MMMSKQEREDANEMRLTFIGQIDELIDVCSRYEREVNARGDDEEQRLVQGAIEYAKEVTDKYRYNGPYKP